MREDHMLKKNDGTGDEDQSWNKPSLAVCGKPFSPESTRLRDTDEPCDEGIH
jgi:hypothetical protein